MLRRYLHGLTCGSDLEALIFDELLHSIGNEEIVILILVADVACFEETFWGERTLCCLWIFPVPFEDVGTFEPELAWCAGGDFLAFG